MYFVPSHQDTCSECTYHEKKWTKLTVSTVMMINVMMTLVVLVPCACSDAIVSACLIPRWVARFDISSIPGDYNVRRRTLHTMLSCIISHCIMFTFSKVYHAVDDCPGCETHGENLFHSVLAPGYANGISPKFFNGELFPGLGQFVPTTSTMRMQ